MTDLDAIETIADKSAMSRVDLLCLMLTVREVNRREAILFRQGKSWMQISSRGHEALMSIAVQLRTGDIVVPYYRCTHIVLGKGASVNELARDYFAGASSSSAGRSVSVHYSSRRHGIFPGLAPTGSHCPAAVGIAWAQKLIGAGDVTLCTIGDGATREGAFYEAVAFAIQERMPIVFLVEDNGFAISTPTADMSPLRLGLLGDVVERFDGRTPAAVAAAGREAIARARAGRGPTVLWAKVDRLDAHTVIEDQKKYRDAAALAKLVDPVEKFALELIESGELEESRWRHLQERTQIEVREVYARAQGEAPAPPDTIATHLYAAPQVRFSSLPQPVGAMQNDAVTMIEAINWTLAAALEQFHNVIIFGQDVEDPKGGVFGLTAGLSARFSGRVINAPVAETTIVGAAAGLATMGFRPVFEIQFIDFLAPAFDQLVNQIASLRWRTAGAWTCPLVLYAPYGAYLPAGGLWHSQSNEGWWTHIPGLRVAVPSTPEDAVGLFWSAIQDDDPTLILIPKHLQQLSVPNHWRAGGGQAIRFGQAKVVTTGDDITIVAWGNCVELAQQASDRARRRSAIACEVIDLRTLIPWDRGAVRQSLKSTGRLVVVQEDSVTSSFGASIIAEIVSDRDVFSYLLASPQLVTRADIHIPYHPQLESAVLPNLADVMRAIDVVMEV